MTNNYYNPYYHPVPPANPAKGIGFGAFVLLAITSGILGLMYIATLTFIPCVSPDGGEAYGWYDCNNSAGNEFMFILALTFAAYVFLVLPTAAILAIVGAAKNSGRKWAIWTISLIVAGIAFGPFFFLLATGDIVF